MPHDPTGRVLLVGAGPGAADLLTLRALKAIEAADVILFDALVGEEIRALFPARARGIEVGKRGHRPSTSQDFINRLMVRLARTGATVVRLKGGDPSIFGRGAEERAFLEAAGVAVEVIAGVTTASAAAAQFGFSLTERETARRVLFATGRTLAGAAGGWRAAADPSTTLCLYMGCADIAFIAGQLVAAGRAQDTPAIAAIDVERPNARLVTSTLAGIAGALAAEAIEGPVLITIGAACGSAVDIPRDLRDAPAGAGDLRSGSPERPFAEASETLVAVLDQQDFHHALGFFGFEAEERGDLVEEVRFDAGKRAVRQDDVDAVGEDGEAHVRGQRLACFVEAVWTLGQALLDHFVGGSELVLVHRLEGA